MTTQNRSRAHDPSALDADTAERLLDGQVAPEDAPPGYGAVVSILRAADAPVRPDEARPEPDHIRWIFEQARRGPVPAVAPAPREQRRTARDWSVRAAVVAVIAGLTLGGGVAMAATGNLPGPIQGAASRVLGAVGVSVPDDPSGSAPVPTSPTTVPTTSPTTVAPTVPSSTTAPPNPAADPTVPTTTAGLPGQGDEICVEASDGRCRAGENGRAGEPNPSDTRPDAPGAPASAGPPSTTANPSVTRPTGPPTSIPGPPVTNAPTAPGPAVTAAPPAADPPSNPSVTRPGNGPR